MRARELIGGSPRMHARITGLVGLVVLASGSFAGSVASRLIVRADPVATADNVAASATLFRLGVVGSLVMMIAFLLYGLLLYRLLEPVARGHATAMVALVVASVPIYMLNQVHHVAVLAFAQQQRYGQVEQYLEFHRFGTLVAAIFFGLWLYPLGVLVFRSGFLPAALGVLLIAGTPGYLVLFVQGFLLPGSEGTLWTDPLLVITHLSELALLLWLLIRGVNVERWVESMELAAARD